MNPQLEIFYGTVPVTDDLKFRAGKLNLRILEFFQANPGKCFTPPEVYVILMPPNPESSVRRSMTTLANLGYLVKDKEKMRPGKYDVLNHTWKLK
jgi:DNA-binding IclR family transcriptional regulator